MPWNPQNTWLAGNFYPEYGQGVDTLSVAVATSAFDVGGEVDTNNSFPGLPESARGTDALAPTGFQPVSIAGATMWDVFGPNFIAVHFTTTAVRDAYAAALASALTQNDVNAVKQNYKDHAGGHWGTIGVAP